MKKSILLIAGIIICIMLFSFFEKKSDYDTKRKNFVKKVNSKNWKNPNLIKSLITEWIRFKIDKSASHSLGLSKFGGTPDLPKAIAWPEFDNVPMVFIAQLNLEQLSKYHKNNLFPKNGILYFFAHFTEPDEDYGAEFEYRMNHQEYEVIYNEDINIIQPTRFPDNLTPDYKFKSMNISFETFFQLPPSIESIQIESRTITDNDKKTLEKFNESENVGLRNQILGIPPAAQASVDFDWSMSYLEMDFSELEKKKTIVDNTRLEFVNLLSFQLFEKIGYAQAYFGINKNDLENREFNKSIFILQAE